MSLKRKDQGIQARQSLVEFRLVKSGGRESKGPGPMGIQNGPLVVTGTLTRDPRRENVTQGLSRRSTRTICTRSSTVRRRVLGSHRE